MPEKTPGKSAIRELLKRPVAFHASLAKLCGSLTAGVMLSQALYWSERTTERDGWFYKTRAEWFEELYLSRYEQEAARQRLADLGFMQSEMRGMPAKVYFRVNVDAVIDALAQVAENQPPRRRKTSQQGGESAASRKTDQHAGQIPATVSAENPPPIKEAETTAETTTEILKPSAAGAAASDPRHAAVRDAIRRLQVTGFGYEIWDGSAAKRLSELLISLPSATVDDLIECVVNRALSLDKPFSEHPRAWLPRLADYQCGPLDRFHNRIAASGADPGGWQGKARFQHLMTIARGEAASEARQ